MNLRCLWPPPHGTTDGRSRWPEDTSVIDSANDPTRNLSGMSAWAGFIARRRHGRQESGRTVVVRTVADV
jgi:hypothetical protein